FPGVGVQHGNPSLRGLRALHLCRVAKPQVSELGDDGGKGFRMRRELNQGAVVVWNGPDWAAFDAAPGRFADSEVGIHVAEPVRPARRPIVSNELREVPCGGHEDDSARLLEAFQASSLVAMQPSDSLQENVRRTEV